MEQFDKISFAEISKDDMKLILDALLYTGENTKSQQYLELRDNIIEELCSLANCSKEDLINLLKK